MAREFRRRALPEIRHDLNNVLGCEIVLMNGEVLVSAASISDAEGYDLLGLINGSEGLLAVVTEVTVRILQKAEKTNVPCWSAFLHRNMPALPSRRSSPPALFPAAWS